MKNNITKLCLCVAGAMMALPCYAQITNRLTFGAGVGFTAPLRWSENRLDTGLNFTANGGVNIVDRFALKLEYGYNQLGISSAVLSNVGVPGGGAHIHSLTLQPEIRFNPKGRLDGYVTFGGGYYRRTVEFTQPSVEFFTGFDPFYGAFVPVGVPTTQVLDSFTQNKGGLNVGAGLTFRVKEDSKAKFFAESKYHYIFTNGRTTLIPVTFGFRW